MTLSVENIVQYFTQSRYLQKLAKDKEGRLSVHMATMQREHINIMPQIHVNICENQRCENQHSAANNAHLIDDPSLPLPGLKDPALPRGEWVFTNQLRRDGHCRMTHTLHNCMGQRKQPTRSHCGQQPQTVEHLLHKCPVTRFTGSLIQLQQLEDEEAIVWSKAYEE